MNDTIREVVAGYVERGIIPGVVTLLEQDGEVQVEVVGAKTYDKPSDPASNGEPLGRDSIFRITSMTKPITAVAAMLLVEEGRLRLDDPVDDLLPELANRQVLKRLDGPLDETVPADRSITVRDLLTNRLGWGLIFESPETHPILRTIQEQGLLGFGPPDPTAPHAPDEWLCRLGELPLMSQPGERWLYNTGSYVLGVLIARAAGQPFESFLGERIFEPLGMKDTGFVVSDEQVDRFVPAYGDEREIVDGVHDSKWRKAQAFPDPGAGLVSTVDDYLAFARMLLNKGAYGNGRLVPEASVEAMTTGQLTSEQQASAGWVLGSDRDWGLGLAIDTEGGVSAGRYGWSGGFGTDWANDPSRNLIGIVLTQRLFSPESMSIFPEFWTAATASRPREIPQPPGRSA